MYKRVKLSLNYIHMNQDLHHIFKEKIDDEQLEGSGLVFRCINDV